MEPPFDWPVGAEGATGSVKGEPPTKQCGRMCDRTLMLVDTDIDEGRAMHTGSQTRVAGCPELRAALVRAKHRHRDVMLGLAQADIEARMRHRRPGQHERRALQLADPPQSMECSGRLATGLGVELALGGCGGHDCGPVVDGSPATSGGSQAGPVGVWRHKAGGMSTAGGTGGRSVVVDGPGRAVVEEGSGRSIADERHRASAPPTISRRAEARSSR